MCCTITTDHNQYLNPADLAKSWENYLLLYHSHSSMTKPTTAVAVNQNSFSTTPPKGFKNILVEARIWNCTDMLGYQAEGLLGSHRILGRPVCFATHLDLDSYSGFGSRFPAGGSTGSTVGPWRQPSCS